MTTAVIDPHKEFFEQLLKSWRSLRKLSQLELALEAEISQRHLSFLESGRARPSREMVLRLSDCLDVPLRERNRLLTSAGFAPIYRQGRIEEPYLAQARKALELTLSHHEPYPAMVLDQDWNIVMSNQASQHLFSQFVDLSALADPSNDQPVNALVLTFQEEGLWQYVRNKDEAGPAIINRVKREALANPLNDQSQILLDKALENKEVPASWQQIDLSVPAPPVVVLELAKDDVVLRLFSMIATFGTPQDITLQELRLETFFPADESTEAILLSMSS